jgi:hypothetical protein
MRESATTNLRNAGVVVGAPAPSERISPLELCLPATLKIPAVRPLITAVSFFPKK